MTHIETGGCCESEIKVNMLLCGVVDRYDNLKGVCCVCIVLWQIV